MEPVNPTPNPALDQASLDDLAQARDAAAALGGDDAELQSIGVQAFEQSLMLRLDLLNHCAKHHPQVVKDQDPTRIVRIQALSDAQEAISALVQRESVLPAVMREESARIDITRQLIDKLTPFFDPLMNALNAEKAVVGADLPRFHDAIVKASAEACAADDVPSDAPSDMPAAGLPRDLTDTERQFLTWTHALRRDHPGYKHTPATVARMQSLMNDSETQDAALSFVQHLSDLDSNAARDEGAES